MDEFSYELKVPKDRIAVLIGKEGKLKTELEEQSSAKIFIDSKEGDVRIKGSDSILMFSLVDVIKAIGRGFNPDIARLLLKQDYVLEIVNISEFVPNKNHYERIKGRVIGANGKTRETIEKLTETFISVYGKTVSIIGSSDRVVIARKAVDSLLQGSTHANVYSFLEKSKARLKRDEMTNWYQES